MTNPLQLDLGEPIRKAKEGHLLQEIVRLQEELEHVKHQRDGYHGQLIKLKKQLKDMNQVNSIAITGQHGCNCHPFKTWAECDSAHRQKLKRGDIVKNRCNGRKGIIEKVEPNLYYKVKYGRGRSTYVLDHSAQLELITKAVIQDSQTNLF